MELIGLVCGVLVYAMGAGIRPSGERRRRAMSDRAAVGYRAALGDDPTKMRRRR